MPHSLDVGFHWTDLTADGSPPATPNDAGTMSYGFQRSTGEVEGQKDFHAQLNDTLAVRVFELTRTQGVRLLDTHVEVVKVNDPDQLDPLSHLAGHHTPHPPNGKEDVPSAALNALGNAWFPTGPKPLDEEGTFLITVRILAEIAGNQRHWVVDPKIIVGRG